MKAKLQKLGMLLTLALLVTACGDSNPIDKVLGNSEDAVVNTQVGGYGGQSNLANQLMNQVPCMNTIGGVSYGQNRRYPGVAFTINGAYSNGYVGQQLQPGNQAGGSTNGVYVGISAVGDVIEVVQRDNGNALIVFHMCEFQPLIMDGRQIQYVQANSALVLDERPDCQGGTGQVTAFSVYMTVDGYNGGSGWGLQQQTFPVTFSRFQDFAPQLCNNGYYY